jgi:acetyltransferase
MNLNNVKGDYMGQFNLERIYKPHSIAVVGASQKQGSIGNAVMTNLINGRFAGKLLPVNPKYGTMHGMPCARSISSLKTDVDLAVIATPIHTVPDVITDCVKQQVGGAIVISAGGKEIGEKGRLIEQQIRQIAYDGNLRIIGPNCLGIIRPGLNLNASFASSMPNKGNIAFVSQSGAICTAVLDLALREHFGFSHFVSTGSMLDVDFGDMIDYLGNDSSTRSILLYIESLTNFRKFMSAARSVSRIKPIIALKSGRSEAGAKAAASHTGAMAGEDAVYDAAFKRSGIVRVDTIQELFDCAELTAKQPRPKGSKLAIITNGGGPGVMAADTLAKFGFEPAALDADTLTKLDTHLPAFWSRSNPIDILGDASPERFRQVLEVCFEARETDAVLVILAPQALADPIPVAQALAGATKGRKHPVFACWMGGRSIAQAVALLNEAGIPTYETPERAVRAFLYMYDYARNLESLQQIPPKLSKHVSVDRQHVKTLLSRVPKNEFMPESTAKSVLAAYGLPVIETQTAGTEAEAVDIGSSLGYPLVMKLHSPDITHKTDAGGVHLDLRSADDITHAFRAIVHSAQAYKPDARIHGVTMQPYYANPDYEILLGAKRDPNFGPVILFGMGGIFTEVLKDRSLGLPPMNRLLARRLMQETKAYALLNGYRNRQPADLEQLEEMIVQLSQLLIDFPEIAELDMNPLLIKNGKAIAVDARILLSPSAEPSPNHLVISPYPAEHEQQATLEDGTKVFIRPVKPEDAPLFISFFDRLSRTSIYFRFFRLVKKLEPDMLARFTQTDYDREVALVALDQTDGREQMLGVARVMGDPDGLSGEFAVIVGDPWQGKGIGAVLLKKCLDIARSKGFETITGFVLSENKGMLSLGKKLGFTKQKSVECGDYELTMRFTKPNPQ